MIRVLSDDVLRSLSSEALASTRRRQHRNLHDSFSDCCQRMFNAVAVDSYIAPHRHSLDTESECLIAVRGLFAIFSFNDNGEITQTELFGSEKYNGLAVGVELTPMVWHTVVALVDGAVLFEVKNGPFDPAKAKDMAPWAPAEQGEVSTALLNVLRAKGQRCYEEWASEDGGDGNLEL